MIETGPAWRSGRRRWPAVLAAAAVAGSIAPPPMTSGEAAIRYRRQGAATLGAPDAVAGSREICEYYPDRVWASHEGVGECIAFYPSKGARGARQAVVFFEGDIPAAFSREPERLEAHFVRAREALAGHAKHFRLPFILMARPGTYGSTGDHRKRRRPHEYHIMSAALDRMRERLGIRAFTLAGQSGGSTVAAAVLALGRQDIQCAALGSGGYDVGRLLDAQLQRGGASGPVLPPNWTFAYFNVMDRIDGIKASPQRRILVIGDPEDKVTPFPLQRQFAERVRAAGHHALVLQAQAKGQDRHGLTALTLRLAGLCATGRSDAQIMRAARPWVAASPRSREP